MGIFIERSKGERTGDASTILFPKYEEFVPKEETEEVGKAKFKQGDMVSWNSSGGRARGKITHIMREGTLGVPDSKFKIKAEPDDPAVLIQIYRDGEETDTFVGHKMSTLSKAVDVSKESPTLNTVHVDSVMGGKKKKKKAMQDGVEIEIEVDGEEEEEDMEEEDEMEMSKAQMKTEDGKQYPAEAFAYVPDPEKPSTWKLRLWDSPEQKETRQQIGRAVAALGPSGFRGNRVQIPSKDMASVRNKIKSAWRKVNADSDKEMPKELK
jgi:hypothetical protein